MPLLDEWKKARLDTLRDEIVNAAKAGDHEQTRALAEGEELRMLRSQEAIDEATALVREVREAAKSAKDPDRMLLRALVARLIARDDSAALTNAVRDAKRRALEIRVAALEAKLAGGSLQGLKLTGAEQVPVNDDKLHSFEARIKALEGRREIEYIGTYQPGTTYHKNQVVTDRGSMWIVRSETADDRPPSKNWQLCVRKGDDAKGR